MKCTVGETRLFIKIALAEQLLAKGRRSVCHGSERGAVESVEGAVPNTVSWAGTSWQRQCTGLARATASNVENACDLRDLACDGRVTLHAKRAAKGVCKHNLRD